MALFLYLKSIPFYVFDVELQAKTRQGYIGHIGLGLYRQTATGRFWTGLDLE